MINSITEQTGADISIEDDGTIYVGAADGPSAQAAIDMINAIANPQLPKIGERFLGTVVKTTAFGAFVSLLPGRDGLVHISQAGQRQADRQGRGRRARSATSSASRSPTSTTAARSAWSRSQEDDGRGRRPDAGGRPGRGPRPDARDRRRSLRGRRAWCSPPPVASPRPAARRAAGASPRRCRACARRRSASGSASARATRPRSRRAPRTSSSTCCSRARRRRTAAEIAQAVDAVGGELNAFTAKEHTCFYAHVLDTDLPLAVDLVADVVTDAALRAGATSSSSATSCSRRSRCATTTRRTCSASCSRRRCSATTRSGGPVIGTEESVRAMDRAVLHAFWRGRYTTPTDGRRRGGQPATTTRSWTSSPPRWTALRPGPAATPSRRRYAPRTRPGRRAPGWRC